jgi:hypothetical protein
MGRYRIINGNATIPVDTDATGARHPEKTSLQRQQRMYL